MPIPEQSPHEATKPQVSNSSTPAPAQGEEWFEDALLNALRAHNRQQAAPAK